MLSGKNILITGGGRGIGAYIAEICVAHHANVFICSRSTGELEKVRKFLSEKFDRKINIFECDIRNDLDIKNMVHKILTSHHRIDILINNAGITGPVGNIEEIKLDDWVNTLNTNLVGAVNLSKSVLPSMKQNNFGKIINIVGGKVGWHGFPPNKTAYITSKFALHGFTEALAAELQNSEIKVNSVSPGSVNTLLRSAGMTLNNRENIVEQDISPVKVGEMIIFLASENSGGLTGKIFSAQWDSPDQLTVRRDIILNNDENTIRKIDNRNYTLVF